jgi:signal transduction histidine kinase
VRLHRPSGPTLVTGVLLVLLPALAVLQYRWVGQVSTAERDRMQRNLRIAAGQFREAFDGEIIRASLNLQVGPGTARDGASDRYSERYDTWLETATHPRVVANVFLLDDDQGELRVRRWNADSHTFDPSPWPQVLEPERTGLERELTLFRSGQPPERRSPFRGEDALIISPIRNGPAPPGPDRGQARAAPVFGFTVLQLDLDYVRDEMLPELAVRHFTHPDGDNYRVAIAAADGRLLYRSDPDAPVDPALADATMPLLGRPDPRFGFGRPGPRSDNRPGRDGFGVPRPRTGPDPIEEFDRRQRPDETGRWMLLVQHQSGSLETAVGAVRRRNLGISFGILLLLSVSIGLLTATARRAQRLAQQQMEFVAGVSHELRTPVAVIRSAAENLAQGVVGGDRVRRYGETIGSEARRLGEMVERVLQYAGIESGLGLGSRVTLSPQEILEAALLSVIARADGEPTVHREIAADLPPVTGDGPALRSAVENLIANAIKYGGADRFVGLKAEHARERGRSEVRITVSDHGAGIPAAELPHIFDPFYRGADATARQVHGSGLGLSLVKRIVNAHGGRVWVTTRAGVGTSFTIALPSAEPDARQGRLAGEVRPAHS